MKLRSALFAAFLAALACSRKDEPATVNPDLDPPDQVSAQAEVKSSSGPVELTLRLHKTQLKLGDSLWHQIRVRNVGKEELLVTDQIFHDPWELRHSIPKRGGGGGWGIYIEVIGPDGQLAEAPLSQDDHTDESTEISGLLEVEGPKETAMLEGWKKQGLSTLKINKKLLAYNLKKRAEADLRAERPVIKLKPNEAAETKSWFYYSDTERRRKKPVPRPIGDFQELEFIELRKPGTYKVRAGYNYRISKEDELEYRKMGMSPYNRVFVLTPWIGATVLP